MVTISDLCSQTKNNLKFKIQPFSVTAFTNFTKINVLRI